jgi:beta-glucosidase
MAARLGDRVMAITTHNEPWVIAVLGHETGIFAPGHQEPRRGHAGGAPPAAQPRPGLQALRADGCRARLGIVLNLSPVQPASDSPGRRGRWCGSKTAAGALVHGPAVQGRYPADVWQPPGRRRAAGRARRHGRPSPRRWTSWASTTTRATSSAPAALGAQTSGWPLTDMGWEDLPEGLTELLLRLHRDYPLPPHVRHGKRRRLPGHAGRRPRARRRPHAYIASHIAAVADAMRQGVPMAGYMVWSLMDNFEWASGYAKRFGIVHVDYATQQRTLKDSALLVPRFLRGLRARCGQGRGAGPEAGRRPEMGQVSLRGIRKSYGAVEVIKGIDLEVEDGEFLVFVGPSGCGKSTCCA